LEGSLVCWSLKAQQSEGRHDNHHQRNNTTNHHQRNNTTNQPRSTMWIDEKECQEITGVIRAAFILFSMCTTKTNEATAASAASSSAATTTTATPED